MFRYLLVSLIVHLLVYFSFFHQRTLVIEDPIVSVTLNSDQPRKAPVQKTTAQKAKAPENLATKTSPEKTQPNETPNESENTELTNNSVDSATAYESGNVSVKPKVLKQIQVSYPKPAKEARVEGAVKLSVLINELGQVREVSVLEGPGYGLNEAATDALKQFLFSPAEVEGQKVSVRIVYVYRFKLESR